MKTYLQWRETNVSAVTAGARTDRSSLGDTGFDGLQQVYSALKTLGQHNPGALSVIISNIRNQIGKFDREAAAAVGSGGRRFVAAAQRSNSNSEEVQ